MELSLARMSAEIGKTLAGSCLGAGVCVCAVTSLVIVQVLLTSSPGIPIPKRDCRASGVDGQAPANRFTPLETHTYTSNPHH